MWCAGKVAIDAFLVPSDFNWKIELPGTGHSCLPSGAITSLSPAPTPPAPAALSYALTQKTAQILEKDFDSHTFKQHPDNSYAAATPAVDADQVYICWIAPSPTCFTPSITKQRNLEARPGPVQIPAHERRFADFVGGYGDPGRRSGCGDKSYVIAMDRKTASRAGRHPSARHGGIFYALHLSAQGGQSASHSHQHSRQHAIADARTGSWCGRCRR